MLLIEMGANELETEITEVFCWTKALQTEAKNTRNIDGNPQNV